MIKAPKKFNTTEYTEVFTDEDTGVSTCDLYIEGVGTLTVAYQNELQAWYFLNHDWPFMRFTLHQSLISACLMELDNYQYQQAFKEVCLMTEQAQSLADLQSFASNGIKKLELVRSPEKWLRLACLICHEPEQYPLHYSQTMFDRMFKRAQALKPEQKEELTIWAQSYLLTYLSYCKHYAPLLFEGTVTGEQPSFMMLEQEANDTEAYYRTLIRKVQNITPTEQEKLEQGLDLTYKQHINNMINDIRESEGKKPTN
jgi:hypothetical protein